MWAEANGFPVAAPQYKEGERWVYDVTSKSGLFAGRLQITYRNGEFEADEPNLFSSPNIVTVHLVSKEERKWFCGFPITPETKCSVRYYHVSAVTKYGTWRTAEIGVNKEEPLKKFGRFEGVNFKRADPGDRRSASVEATYIYSPSVGSAVFSEIKIYAPGSTNPDDIVTTTLQEHNIPQPIAPR